MSIRVMVVLACLCAFTAAVYGQISGSWSTFLRTDLTGATWDTELDSVLDIDARLAPWTLDATAHFRDTAFDLLQFQAAGDLGPLEIYSLVEFFPLQTASLRIAASSVQLTLGGMNLYALGTLSPHPLILGSGPGAGLLLGGWTLMGEAEVHIQTAFNMWSYAFVVANEGFATFLRGMAARPQCDEYGLSLWWWPSIYYDFFIPLESTCSLTWSSTEILVKAPFLCTELTAMLSLMNLPLFGAPSFSASFLVENVSTGLPWLWVDPIILSFSPQEKNLATFFDLRFGEFACITPYFTYEPAAIPGTEAILSAIRLDAITLHCDITPGVSFKGGHRFSDFGFDFDLYELPVAAFTAWGDFVYWRYSGDTGGQVWNVDYDEYYALLVDGDSCCGGQFDAWFYFWFDTTQTGAFFDWAEIVLGADVDIAHDATIKFHLGVLPGEIHFIDFGFEFRW